jgi:hypothetical protein
VCELRQEVNRFHDRVARGVHEQVGVDLAGVFVSVVGNPACVGEEVAQTTAPEIVVPERST